MAAIGSHCLDVFLFWAVWQALDLVLRRSLAAARARRSAAEPPKITIVSPSRARPSRAVRAPRPLRRAPARAWERRTQPS